jgi:hypothetical protein
VVPADNKWFTRAVVAAAIVQLVESLGLAYPALDAAQRRELEAMHERLLAEPGGRHGS